MTLKRTQTNREQALAHPTIPARTTCNPEEKSARGLDEAYAALIKRAHNNNDYSVLRLSASASKMGRANSTFWADVKKGTVTPPIRIGERSVGWLLTELDAILAARALASRANMPLDIKLFVSLLAAPRLASTEFTVAMDGVANA